MILKQFFHNIHMYLANCKGETYSFFKYHGYKVKTPFRVFRLRHKKNIKVLFVVSEISMWKTETLYLMMLRHPRFRPSLLPVSDITKSNAREEVVSYFEEKGYKYQKLEECDTIQSAITPDIIFYQQAYPKFIEDKWFEMSNRKSLFCHVNYCFQNTIVSNSVDRPLQNLAWMVFSENYLCAKEIGPMMKNKGRNLVVTGLPFMDELLLDKSKFVDRWNSHSTQRKRIIYAPHHSIMPEDLVSFASILDYGEFILSMAKKYAESTQWVFKPHPFLEPKLKKVWGEERTKKFYDTWRTLSNTQIIEGGYIDIFKYSDAMIHDCGSFLLEYQYTGNPVLFLQSSQPKKTIRLNQFSEQSKALHYHARTHDEIESFIKNVISGFDPMKESRNKFFSEAFVPPYEKTASQNIINAILGVEDYKTTNIIDL